MKTHPKFLPRLAAGLFTLAAGSLPVLTILTVAPAQGQPAAQEVSFDFFYGNLADNGDWYNTPDFGYVFQPYIAYKNENWRPYTDGYWAQTDQGWTWVSYEDFGWATYHYGRWSQLENVGWVWVPGYEWGPGWVSWRTSEEYVGWAPLPPKSTRQVASTTLEQTGGSSFNGTIRPEDVEEDYDTGYNGSVDVQYDIGPSQYSFVPVQSFGAPYLAEAVVPQAQNIIIIEGTTNVTNIVYRGDRDRRVIYCGGPDYAFISRRTERPIPRLLLERRTELGPDRNILRGDRFNTVRDNRLEFFAPLVSRRPVNVSQVRPLRVKESLDRPQIIHGWNSAQRQDPRLADRLRESFRQQARQAPPARQGVENFVTPAAFRAQPPPNIQEQQRLHQPPPPRTAEGNRFGGRPPGTEGNQPPAPPAGGPPPNVVARPPQQGGAPAAVQPVPGPGGRNLSDAERQARRDARQRELDQRQGGRPANPQPVNPPAPPNVVNRENNPPAPVAPGQPARPNRSEQERDAYRASKQAEKAREQAARQPAQTPPEGNPAAHPPAQPFQSAPGGNPERRREEGTGRGGRTREQEVQPQPDAAREQRRAERSPEEQGQRAAQQQAQQQQQAAERVRAERQQQVQQQQTAERARAAQEQSREQRRPERPPQVDQAQQAQREAVGRAREAQREAAPQQQRPQAPEPRRQPEARPQPQPQPQPAQAAQPGKGGDEERKKKHGDNPGQ